MFEKKVASFLSEDVQADTLETFLCTLKDEVVKRAFQLVQGTFYLRLCNLCSDKLMWSGVDIQGRTKSEEILLIAEATRIVTNGWKLDLIMIDKSISEFQAIRRGECLVYISCYN